MGECDIPPTIAGVKTLTHWGRDDTFNRIFVNENVIISIEFSLKFVPKGPINNIPALDPIMAWHRPGDKPLSEPVMVILLKHICVTRPQWVKSTGVESGIFWKSKFNTTAIDDLAPSVARSSTAMVLITYGTWVNISRQERFQQPAPFKCWGVTEVVNTFCFRKTSARKGPD